jgi:S-formylglutathione hydrolase FrmB
MRRGTALASLATLVLTTVLMSSPAASAEEQSPGVGGIRIRSVRQVDPRLFEYQLSTPALAKPTGLRVLLPEGYAANPGRRYPVLYLLHGASDNFRFWTDHGDADRTTAHAPAIIVMPDGGQGGWYSNWFNGGVGGPPEWETYHLNQLVPWVDAHFRTQPGGGNRSIAGLSMGGFGALSYAARHPGMFASAAAFSGAVNINLLPLVFSVATSPLLDSAAPDSIFGPKMVNEDLWRAHNPLDLADRLRGTRVALYTGDGRPGPYDKSGFGDFQESVVHNASASVDQRLTGLGIPHTYVDYGPGTHTAPYWARDLRQELPSIMASFSGAKNGS